MLLSWTAGYNGNLDITEYILQIKRQDDESDLVLWTDAQTYSVAASSVPYRVLNLHPGTQYMVRVKAKNRIGFSDYSNVFLFSTKEKGTNQDSNIFVKILNIFFVLHIIADLLIDPLSGYNRK